MTWEVVWSNQALKDTRNLDKQTNRRIVDALRPLSSGTFVGLKRLKGRDKQFRVRVGDWRVLLKLEPSTRTIAIARILHRREAYR